MGTSEHAPKNPLEAKKFEFTRSRRQIRAMQRQGTVIPEALMDKCIEADKFLTVNMEGWVSNFGFSKEELIRKT